MIRAWRFQRHDDPSIPDGEWWPDWEPKDEWERGKHASVRGYLAAAEPWDAITVARGSILELVDADDVVGTQAWRIYAKRLRVVRRMDVFDLSRAFERWCALRVIDKWDAPDVVRDYLTTGDESIRAAASRAADKYQRDVWKRGVEWNNTELEAATAAGFACDGGNEVMRGCFSAVVALGEPYDHSWQRERFNELIAEAFRD